MQIGFIKLHRQLLEWEWYDDINTFRLFTHLLLKANYEPKKWHGIDIGIGQFLTSRETLARETALSEQQVRTALTKLKSTNEITSQATNNYSLISITNWEKWQGSNQPSNNPSTSYQPAINQPSTTTKEVKKERSKDTKEIDTSLFDNFWVLYPRKINKADAKKIFTNIIKKGVVDYETIIIGVKNYNEKCRGQDEKFIAHATTWLNKERWADQYQTAEKPTAENQQSRLNQLKEQYL